MIYFLKPHQTPPFQTDFLMNFRRHGLNPSVGASVFAWGICLGVSAYFLSLAMLTDG